MPPKKVATGAAKLKEASAAPVPMTVPPTITAAPSKVHHQKFQPTITFASYTIHSFKLCSGVI